MNRGDQAVEKGADKLDELSQKASERGGVAEKAAQPFAEDADLVRKMKPSLIAARARGEAPTDGTPGGEPVAPPGPQIARRRSEKSGPNPFAVVGGMFGLGYFLAKVVDWRGHAHPND